MTCVWKFYRIFWSYADFFQNEHFRKIISGIASECQTGWIQIRPKVCQAWSGSKLFEKVISRRQKWSQWQVKSYGKKFDTMYIDTKAVQFQLLSSTDNLCKQFGPRSWSVSKLYETLIVFLKEFLKKFDNFEKFSRWQQKHGKLPRPLPLSHGLTNIT